MYKIHIYFMVGGFLSVKLYINKSKNNHFFFFLHSYLYDDDMTQTEKFNDVIYVHIHTHIPFVKF